VNQYEFVQRIRAINCSIAGKEGNLGKRFSAVSPSIVSLEDGVLHPSMQEKLDNIKKILTNDSVSEISPEELKKVVQRLSKSTMKKIIKQLYDIEHCLEDELINANFKHSSYNHD